MLSVEAEYTLTVLMFSSGEDRSGDCGEVQMEEARTNESTTHLLAFTKMENAEHW